MLSSLLSFRRPTTKHAPALSEDSPCYLHSNEKIPIFSKHDKFLTTQQVITSLLDPSLNKTSICRAVPFSVACNSVFIVDLSCLDSPKDVQCDDMGAWKDNGHFKQWCSVTEDGAVTFHGKTRPSTHDSMYFITRKYYVNKSSRDVQKMVILLKGKSCKFYPVLVRLSN